MNCDLWEISPLLFPPRIFLTGIFTSIPLVYCCIGRTSVSHISVLLVVAQLLGMLTCVGWVSLFILFICGREEQSFPLFVVLLIWAQQKGLIIQSCFSYYVTSIYTGWAWIQGWGVKEYSLCMEYVIGITRVLSRFRASVSSLIYSFWLGGIKSRQKQNKLLQPVPHSSW